MALSEKQFGWIIGGWFVLGAVWMVAVFIEYGETKFLPVPLALIPQQYINDVSVLIVTLVFTAVSIVCGIRLTADVVESINGSRVEE